ncbi:MAG TPA: SGNH/GDSL hydrolase family protein [Bryobacteraceae bacterium]|jgi:lysophospholipase L1-like esterase
MRTLFPLLLIGSLSAVGAWGQLVEEFNPPRGNCCLPASAQTLANQLLDWNQLGRYHAANEALKKQPADPKRVVFMGDSITDIWKLADQFPGKPYVDRGISGQTTPQMLVRMYPDVIDLKPAAVAILAGTNDIAHNTGPETAAMIEENIQAMTDIAQAHGIKVILCSVTPISDYTRPQGRGGAAADPNARTMQSVQRPPADILKLNAWMKDYAAKVHAVYADYFAALVDDKGMLKDGFSADGLHPNQKGFDLMAPVIEAAIQKALQ